MIFFDSSCPLRRIVTAAGAIYGTPAANSWPSTADFPKPRTSTDDANLLLLSSGLAVGEHVPE